MDDNPRNKYFAADLFDRFGSRTQVERKQNAEVKKKVQYDLVQMDLSANKKLFNKDT